MEGPAATWARMSPEDVLAVLVEDYRHQVLNDPEAVPGVNLTFDTTVDEWRMASDLLSWKPLAMAMNKRFGVEIEYPRWKEILKPARDRRLRLICDEIAPLARKRVVEPIKVFGRDCREASFFFAVRRILKESGLDVSQLRPSSLLFPYVRNHWPIFLGRIAVLAPGSLPQFRVKDRTYNALLALFMLGLVSAMVFGLLKSPAVAAALATLAGVAYITVWIRSSMQRPLDEAAFGDLQTFADLCSRLASTRG